MVLLEGAILVSAPADGSRSLVSPGSVIGALWVPVLGVGAHLWCFSCIPRGSGDGVRAHQPRGGDGAAEPGTARADPSGSP